MTKNNKTVVVSYWQKIQEELANLRKELSIKSENDFKNQKIRTHRKERKKALAN